MKPATQGSLILMLPAPGCLDSEFTDLLPQATYTADILGPNWISNTGYYSSLGKMMFLHWRIDDLP